MSQRKRKLGTGFHPDEVRQKIQAIKLVQRLHQHIFEDLKLSLSQVRAIDILLKKCVPDLTSTTVTANMMVRYVAELPPMLSREEWEQKYGHDHLDLKAEPLAITNGSGNLQ